jgi:hypothetical protein
MTCDDARRRLDTVFIEGGSDGDIREHTRGCLACRDYHHRLFSVDAALTGGPESELPGLGRREQELLLARVLDGAAGEGAGRRVGFWQRLLAVGGWPAFTAAAAALLVVVMVRTGGPGRIDRAGGAATGGAARQSDEFAARSMSVNAPPSGPNPGQPVLPDGTRAPVGLRALCLVEGPGGPEVRALGDRPLPGEAPRCTVRDRLGFTVRNETGVPLYWVLSFQHVDGVRRTLGSDDDAGQLAPSAEEAPLGVTVELSRLGAGRHRVNLSAAPRRQGPARIAGPGDPVPMQSVSVEIEVAP